MYLTKEENVPWIFTIGYFLQPFIISQYRLFNFFLYKNIINLQISFMIARLKPEHVSENAHALTSYREK